MFVKDICGISTQTVKVSLASVLKLQRDYDEIKRLRDKYRDSKLYDVYNARFLAYNNIISDLNLPVGL